MNHESAAQARRQVSDIAAFAAFAAARLDEDEAAARTLDVAFGAAGWMIAENDGEFGESDFTVTAGQLATESVADMWREDAAGWIARHDPARVLRDVAAKRALIDFAFEIAEAVDGEWGCDHTAAQIRAGDCGGQGNDAAGRVLLPVVSVWSDHPDYDPAWEV